MKPLSAPKSVPDYVRVSVFPVGFEYFADPLCDLLKLFVLLSKLGSYSFLKNTKSKVVRSHLMRRRLVKLSLNVLEKLKC